MFLWHWNLKVSTLRQAVLARGPGVEIGEVLQCCDGVGRGHGKNCMFQGRMKKKISHPILANTFQGTATRYQEKKPRELSDDYCTCHEEILCQIHSALPFHSPLPQSSPEQNAWSFAVSKRFGRLVLDGHNLNGRRWQKQRVESHQREVCKCFQ